MAEPIQPPPLLPSGHVLKNSYSGLRPLMAEPRPLMAEPRPLMAEPRPLMVESRPFFRPKRSVLDTPSSRRLEKNGPFGRPGPKPLMAEPNRLSHGWPDQPGEGRSEPFSGSGFGLVDPVSLMRRWVSQDRAERGLSSESPSFESPPKRAKLSRDGRNASFGISAGPLNPGMVQPDEPEDRIKVDKVLTDKKFNVWDLPAKAKVLLLSNLPCNVANPRFVSPCSVVLRRFLQWHS